jgi:hypothetical protein
MIRLVVFVLAAGLAIVGCERIVDLTPDGPRPDAPGTHPPDGAMDAFLPLPDAFVGTDALFDASAAPD